MARLKAAGPTILMGLLVFGFLETIYDVGYYRGFRNGSAEMRDAIMCVLERTAGIQPFKYCRAVKSEQSK